MYTESDLGIAHRSGIQEGALGFAQWLMENHPDCFYKYGEDDDGGVEAMNDLFNNWITYRNAAPPTP